MTGMKLALIGLDTSHTIEFTRLIQGETPDRIEGLRVLSCLRFPSPFQSEAQQDDRQKQMEEWGVTVTRSLEEAVEGVDAVLLEINDPAQHLAYFEKVSDLGLPVFIDKPLAGNLEDARQIVSLARERQVKVWESSALRFLPEMIAAVESIGQADTCNVFGALGKAAAGSSLVWYGCHTFHMLHAIMGPGAKSVQAIEGEGGIVALVDYGDGRQGTVECRSKNYRYGGHLIKGKELAFFQNGGGMYISLLENIRKFLLEGVIPVSLEQSLEVQTIMDAAERSLRSGSRESLE